MSEQLKNFLTSFKQFWSNASKKLKIIIIGCASFILILAIVLSIALNSKDYVVIFEDLASSENTEILAKLQEMGVEVRAAEGDIMVPAEEESNVRMQLATEGYPKSGLNYYLIEESNGMLTTDYQRKQYENMQLQERIAASIKTLEGVKDAVVTIAAGSDDTFYLQEKEAPTASVIVHMKDDAKLTDEQITGIQNLVTKSVQGLTKDNVALLDGQGNDLIETSSASRTPEILKLTVTREIESDIRKKIMSVLVGPYESKDLKVAVSATVNLDDLIQESTVYQPSPDGNNSGVISEETRSDESSSSSQQDGGVPGTDTNSQVTTYPTTGGTGSSSSSSSGESITYQVSQIKSQSQNKGAKVEAISIGVAVNKASFDPGERDSVTELVAFAAGVTPDDVTVQNFRFPGDDAIETTTGEGRTVRQMLPFIIAAVALLLIAAIVACILHSKKKRREEEAAALAEAERLEAERQAALAALRGTEEGDGVEPISVKPPQDTKRDEIKEFAVNNPEIAAQMIKSWLRSEND